MDKTTKVVIFTLLMLIIIMAIAGTYSTDKRYEATRDIINNSSLSTFTGIQMNIKGLTKADLLRKEGKCATGVLLADLIAEDGGYTVCLFPKTKELKVFEN